MKIIPIIGLEVHVELKTNTKMFCNCSAQHFHIDPNTHTCPVCLGLPGALPVPNKTACQWCIKIGLALGCTPNLTSFFERKNYFYPDLAKGYQITQFEKPFVINGKITIDGQEIRINRAHMEEDTGKSVHISEAGQDLTLIDYNRCGVPLVEIVSEPDITSPEMAKNYLLKIQQIIRYLGVSDADIEKGSMRCEPTINLKIKEDGKEFFTPLAEIKNVASLTGVLNALNFEINRQTKEFIKTREEKSKTNKTTRGWDAAKNKTFLQREKEGSSDYRYFPEPDIPHITFTQNEIEDIRKTLPELPDQKVQRYKKDFGLNDYDANLITQDIKIAEVFDYSVKVFGNNKENIKKFVNLFNGEFRREEIDINKVKPDNWLKVITMLNNDSLSSTSSKVVFTETYKTSQDPIEIAKSKGLIQVSNSGEIEKIAKEVLEQNPKAVEDYKKNPNSIGFLIGQLMKASHGSANPTIAKTVLEKLLK
ncbi:MAG: Asp-tRNA(Asn)/Glu-tRNA(Gln) amidotransferase subunit GatB [Candidatus Shapirobacteria bacterium]|nr:Asp-tRNA(Asn)/Glu-tRNA(Gln) amidotransferase subunit GatB [Candidatus Shapirobacteria bacterium]